MLRFHIGSSHIHILRGGFLVRVTQYSLKGKGITTILDITSINVDRSWWGLATHRHARQTRYDTHIPQPTENTL